MSKAGLRESQGGTQEATIANIKGIESLEGSLVMADSEYSSVELDKIKPYMSAGNYHSHPIYIKESESILKDMVSSPEMRSLPESDREDEDRRKTNEESIPGIHPSFQKLFKKVHEIIEQIQSRDDPITCTRSRGSSRKDMSINRRVIDLSVGRSSITDMSEKPRSIRHSRTLHLHTESRVNQFSVIPGRSLRIQNQNRSESLMNSQKGRKTSKSKSKGISLVSPSTKKKYYQHQLQHQLSGKKIKVVQKKEPKQVKTQRRNSFNPAMYFSGRRISTKLF